ncbi:MAG: beta tubulin [Oceanicaulis sp.]|nr:beta tubulin [Oceanicaulis sp.]
MIDIPPALQAMLDAGVTTLCWVWILTRRDGARFGFTDHDQALELEGVNCEPVSGFSHGDLRSETGGAPARGAVFGQLDSGVITRADIAAGVWDGAGLALYRVDWTEPSLFWRAFTGELGEIRHGDQGFEADVSGLSARLNRTIGWAFSRLCDAELGDARCGVDLDAAGRRAEGAVSEQISARAMRVSGASSLDASALIHGVLSWPGASWPDQRIVSARNEGAERVIELEGAVPEGVTVGQAVHLNRGCDKRFETCASRFNNALNFRGCPHMPGNDALVRPVSARR